MSWGLVTQLPSPAAVITLSQVSPSSPPWLPGHCMLTVFLGLSWELISTPYLSRTPPSHTPVAMSTRPAPLLAASPWRRSLCYSLGNPSALWQPSRQMGI